jgi:basic amino acid/polyamine antiporter, APA family
VIGAVILIALLAALNIKGTKESTRVNLVLALADLFTQVLLVAVGLVLVLSPDTLVSQVELGTAPTWGDAALGIAIGMVAYTGIETISNMAEEAKDAPRNIPRGVGYVVLAVLGLYVLLPAIALSAMPVVERGGEFTTALGTQYQDDPVLGIVENLGLAAGLTDVLRFYVGVLAAVILIIATNAALIGVSRLTFSMGHYRQLPERLRQIHPRLRTPYIAIAVFSLVAMLTVLPGETSFLATMYSFGAMLSFTIAHVSVLRLRQVQPYRERPKERRWRPLLGNVHVFGTYIPLTAVLGALGTFSAWIVVMALDPITIAVGGGWMALGMTLYLLYRRYQGLPATDTVKVVLPEALGVEEVEYESVVVAFDDRTPFSGEVVATAVKLAGRRRRGIHVHSMITVPSDLPLDAELEQAEGEAQSKIEKAKLIGGLRVTGHIERVRPGQAGYSIAEEARQIKARAIVIGLRRRDGRPLYDKTIQTVLSERPCRVIVVSVPEAEPKPAPVPAVAGP